MTSSTIRPFLMFEGRAAEALAVYREVFPEARVINVEHHPSEGSAGMALIKLATLAIGGLEILVSDSTIAHAFTFTPSMSLFVDCATIEEVDRRAGKLADGGRELMPVGDYGFSRRFAWVADRFGVSWQLNCA